MGGSARHLASCVAAFVLCTTSGLALGASGGAELASLAATERRAVVELFAAEVALTRARADAERHARHERALAAARARLVARSDVVRASLRATHQRIGTLLRRLYVEGEADPIEVLLGARSLGAVLEGVEGLERATRRNRALAAQARLRARSLATQLARLTRTQAMIADTRRRAVAATIQLEAATDQRRATILALRRRQDLSEQRLAAEAREAERAAALVGAPVALVSDDTPAEASTGAIAAGGPPTASARTRTLVVDAVAYHLPGRTASGIPVGVGVIAVDPTVIPLGTRLFVPGYGPAVAADTGSAIRGAVIDLWMPSTAGARAWGRRTVTITVYG